MKTIDLTTFNVRRKTWPLEKEPTYLNGADYFEGYSIHLESLLWVESDESFQRRINVGTVDWHMEIIKSKSFRGKIIETNEPLVVIIKVSGIRSKVLLENWFECAGVACIVYKIQLLGWFECWFPRYQIEG